MEPAGAGCRLVADVGGTNARFALVRRQGEPEETANFRVADFPTFEQAAGAYLQSLGTDLPPLAGLAIAAAGPVRNGAVSLTNANWRMSVSNLSQHFGGIPVRLMNDLAAVALALPALGSADCIDVAAGTASAEPLPLLALNVGTGLGAAVAIPDRGGWIALPTEAGHMRFAATNRVEFALLEKIETVEQLIAGPGWQRFEAAAPSEPAEGPGVAAANGRAALYGSVLGRFAGDLVLATGAWGGVFLCGGALSGWERLVDERALIDSFRRHGAMSDLLAEVPVRRLVAEQPALIGLSRLPL